MVLLATEASEAADLTGWDLGLLLGVIVVCAVVGLVIPILLLARKIGLQAAGIDASLQRSREHTAGLTGLNETIEHAVHVIGGLTRARTRLGG